ncbi:FAD-dependent oxidoreductase [Flocculibacter collagenilyticus]|uniref:FAD-dependent oxidoreductase n=1 Tax=Flocculibacter collagenilyticus TaxID=2744479 RepID=UPI0018F57CEB|nr:NAD(P)/FAD-dependent oxidoreductase [Flocculibacter collagenilyticus]
MTKQAITIIGAGLVGSLLAMFLAKRNYQVTVFEKRSDMRNTEISAGRSINLALANRGIFPLEQVGIMDEVEKMLIPMAGRMLHDEYGELNFQPYGIKEHEVIYSVSRADLNKRLMDSAESTGNVTFHFDHNVENIDFTQQVLQLKHANAGKTLLHNFSLLIGADGTGSKVREQMLCALNKSATDHNIIETLPHSYKELCIPATTTGDFQIEKQALHIWPRGQYMLIALPNMDGSFTVTLFLPNEGKNSFATLSNRDAVMTFFQQEFPDALALIPDLANAFFDNPTGKLGTVRCKQWHNITNTLLIGDAAHGIVPFHGQGMNCGFEDCSELNRLLIEHNDDWQAVLPAFQAVRQPNADAIAEMALENYIEMRDSVRDNVYILKKALAFELEKRFPNRFIPRYSMVMFHRLPYAEAQSRGRIQQNIIAELLKSAKLDEKLTQLTKNTDIELRDCEPYLENIDMDYAKALIEQQLPM